MRSGAVIVGAEQVVANAVGNTVAGSPLHGFCVVSARRDIAESGCTIGGLVLGDGAAVGIGCGLGSAAVLGGSGLHLDAVLLGLGLDLGAVGLGGGLHLSGAAGIVTVRGRTAAGAAEAARGRSSATGGRTAGGLGLNGQRVNGVQSFLWRKGNSSEAGVVDRPPRCPLPVVELCQRMDDLAVA